MRVRGLHFRMLAYLIVQLVIRWVHLSAPTHL